MTLLQQSRYDQLLRRVGDLKGAGSKVADVLTELFPMFDVESNRAELQLLSGTRLCMGSTRQANVAAVTSRSQLFNPPDSGVIAVVTHVWAVSDPTLVPINVTMIIAFTGSPTLTDLFRDGRLGIAANPTCQTGVIQDAVVTTPTLRFNSPPTVMAELSDENGIMVLSPGTGIEVGTQLVNRELDVSYLWRERVAEPSELNF